MIGHSTLRARALQLGLRIFNKTPAVPEPKAETWYSIKAVAEGETEQAIEVFIYGEIGTCGITANQFIQDLKAIDDGVSPVVVAFNSIGGDLFDGLAIHNVLNRLGERCSARVDALAASAASVAACGAHRLVMASNAMLMIHNPWTWAGGDADDFRKVADVLDQTLEVIVASYKRKAPEIDDAELRQLIKDETWLPAAEAKALGLCDEVLDGLAVKAMVGDGGALRKYRNAPRDLLAQLEALPVNEPPAPADDPEPTPPITQPNAGALAARIIRSCSEAGISNLVEALTMSGDLEDEASVDAAITRAKAVRDLCISARLPELAPDYVKAGLEPDAVRARLFDKLAGNGFGEIINTPPLEDEPPAPTKAKAAVPSTVYAERKAARNAKTKASKGEA
ncbi:Clp protease ClpP [Pseudomonas sp. HMSC75E02]|uniref:head maturation protease, ClpP-related n=1 Tax=Pseudomonas sp. HMSC75E02 TaxID=1608908 RepID=UPI0008A8D7C4|nr:head maturation protease, ClpP-related [Pseudomonas sp. HMSC75E02]OHS09292.1 Clp protease ClpP [Pseudomonas sp. HMSC75E02]